MGSPSCSLDNYLTPNAFNAPLTPHFTGGHNQHALLRHETHKALPVFLIVKQLKSCFASKYENLFITNKASKLTDAAC
jgi:hypothetical protein